MKTLSPQGKAPTTQGAEEPRAHPKSREAPSFPTDPREGRELDRSAVVFCLLESFCLASGLCGVELSAASGPEALAPV